MYKEFYKLKEKPFELSPSLHFLYLGESHKEAFDLLTCGVVERKGLILLTGEVGAGKSTMVKALLANLDKSVQYVYLANPLFSVENFRHCLASSTFKKKVNFRSDTEFLIEFEAFLQECLKHQKNFILIIDEAHKLSFALLEEIRLLSDIATADKRLINIILIGQPELDEKLSLPRSRPLLQRISVRYHIKPLGLKGTEEYITMRLQTAGAENGHKIFSGDAIKAIHQYSAGYPKNINILANYALLLGYALRKSRIKASVVEETVKDLSWLPFSTTNETRYLIPMEKGSPKLNPKTSRHGFASAIKLALATCLIVAISLLFGNPWLKLQQEESITTHNAVRARITSQPDSPDQPTTILQEAHVPVGMERQVNLQNRQHARFLQSAHLLEQDGFQDNLTGDPGLFPNEDPIDGTYTYSITEQIQGRLEEADRGKHLAVDIKNPKPQAVEEVNHSLLNTHPYTLRLSCFRSKKNAQKALLFYERNSLSPYLVKADADKQGVWWIIYMGHYKTEEEAKTAKEHFNLLDSIVRKMPYASLIGDFSSRSEMAGIIQRLKNLGYSPYLVRAKKGIFRLFAGAFVTREGAAEQNDDLKSNGIQSQIVEG